VRLSWTILPESHAIYSVFNDQTHADQIIQDVSKHLNSMGVGVQNQAHFEEHFRGCWDLRSMTFVGANGTVAACCSRWIALGSLHQNTFEDIWNGMPHRRIGFGIFNGKPTAPCRSCRQIRPLGYKGRKEDFIMPQATGEAVLKEKTRKLDTLPTLKGLDTDFAAGVKALFSKDFQDALKIFSKLEDRFPDFYEIKNNLAITHHFLKNESKSHELLKSIEKMAFMETMM